MNRKQAMLTILAGVVPWVKLARAAPREDLPAPVRGPAPVPAPTVEDLQKQVTDLTRRLQAVEAAQARVVGFTKVGNDLLLDWHTGNVSLKSAALNFDSTTTFFKVQQSFEARAGTSAKVEGATSCEVKGGSSMNVTGSSSVNVNGALVSVNAGGNLQLKAGATLDQKASIITLN